MSNEFIEKEDFNFIYPYLAYDKNVVSKYGVGAHYCPILAMEKSPKESKLEKAMKIFLNKLLSGETKS